jgi:hypothetical protein
MPWCRTSPKRAKALLDTITIFNLRRAGLSFAAIGKHLNPPTSKQNVHKLFWKGLREFNRNQRERAEEWRRIVEACERMDRIDPPPGKRRSRAL